MTGEQFHEMIGELKVIETGKGKVREEIGNKMAFKMIVKDLKVLARSSP
jgi:hypothetical protein